MDLKQPLGEYLQGALAGKMIESPAKVDECTTDNEFFPMDAVVQVVVPPVVTTGSSHEVSVRIRNAQSVWTKGVVTLQGEDLDRDCSYEFQAPFHIAPDQPGACIVFSWAVPRFRSKIKWSASATLDGRMGVGLSGSSTTTRVTEPRS